MTSFLTRRTANLLGILRGNPKIGREELYQKLGQDTIYGYNTRSALQEDLEYLDWIGWLEMKEEKLHVTNKGREEMKKFGRRNQR